MPDFIPRKMTTLIAKPKTDRTNQVAPDPRKRVGSIKFKPARGVTHETSENYLNWLLVENYPKVKKAFDEAD